MKPILKRLEQITSLRWLNLYNIVYEYKGKSGSWLMASRKKLADLHDTFMNQTQKADAVIVVPLVNTPEGQKLLVTKEWRHPVGDFEWAFPAGIIDKDETPETAGRRELKEETGLDIETIEKISPPIVSSAGLSDESVVMIFCTAKGTLSIEGNEDHEIIEPHLLNYAEVLQLCDRTGKFENAVIGAKTWPVLYMLAKQGYLK